MALPYHSQCSVSVFYTTLVCISQFNLKEIIRSLWFKMQFGFALYIDYYKIALNFNLVTIYKGVDRIWKDNILGKFNSIEFSSTVHCGNFLIHVNLNACKPYKHWEYLFCSDCREVETIKCAINITWERGKCKLQKSITLVFSRGKIYQHEHWKTTFAMQNIQ